MSYLIDLYVLCTRRDSRIKRFLDWLQIPEGERVEFAYEEDVFERVVGRATEDVSLEGSIYRDDSKIWRQWSIHFIEDGAVIFSIALPNSRFEEIREILTGFVAETGGDFGYGAAETPPPSSVREFQELANTAPVLDWVVGDTSVFVNAT